MDEYQSTMMLQELQAQILDDERFTQAHATCQQAKKSFASIVTTSIFSHHLHQKYNLIPKIVTILQQKSEICHGQARESEKYMLKNQIGILLQFISTTI